jgi:hypothetical protein
LALRPFEHSKAKRIAILGQRFRTNSPERASVRPTAFCTESSSPRRRLRPCSPPSHFANPSIRFPRRVPKRSPCNTEIGGHHAFSLKNKTLSSLRKTILPTRQRLESRRAARSAPVSATSQSASPQLGTRERDFQTCAVFAIA